jgi:hypothetical protein
MDARETRVSGDTNPINNTGSIAINAPEPALRNMDRA